MAQAYSQWMDNEAVARGEVIHPGPPIHIRDQMEARRLRTAFEPGAEYPLGYLDTVGVGSRRDRLANPQRSALNSGSYQRGVHAFTKVPVEDYLWPIEFHLLSGVQRQATGQRWISPVQQLGYERRLMNGGRAGPADVPNAPELTPMEAHNAMLERGRPPWS